MFEERQYTTTNNLKDHKTLKRKDSKIDLIEDHNFNI